MIRRKVLFLIPGLSGGGAERATAMIASALDPDRFEAVLCLERDLDETYAVAPHVRVIRLHATSTRAAFRPLVRVVRRERPDLVYGALPHLNVLVALAARFVTRRPVVVASVHNNLQREFPLLEDGNALERLTPWVYRGCDVVVAVSQGVAAQTRDVYRAGDRVRVIADPLDLGRIRELASSPAEHPWLVSYDVLVAMGRLELQKNYPLMLRAFAAVVASHPAARLIVLGDGGERSALEHTADALGVSDAVAFVGAHSNPFSFVSHARGFVMASDFEGFGMALAEAMAIGTPVISTDAPHGPADILEDGRHGQLVPVGDEKRLAAAMRSLLDHPDHHVEVAKGARRHVEAFALERVGRDVETLFTSLIDARRHRRRV